MLAASPTYLSARGTPRTPDDLRAHDCVAVTGSGPFAFEGATRGRVRLKPKVIADDGFFVREAVRLGMGIGMLPAFLATARKAAYDTYATTPQERAIVDEEYAAITTRGEAKAFVARVMAKATLFRDSQPRPVM